MFKVTGTHQLMVGFSMLVVGFTLTQSSRAWMLTAAGLMFVSGIINLINHSYTCGKIKPIIKK